MADTRISNLTALTTGIDATNDELAIEDHDAAQTKKINISDLVDAIITHAKGKIIVSDGSTFGDLTLGTDGNVLTADSAQALGVKWATPADLPTATVVMYGGTEASVPAGWLLCDGAAVSRTTYSGLFAAIGEEYGAGDGTTTFNVPDLQTSNRFPRGATNDAGRGTTGGSSTHVLTESEMPSHTHTVSPNPHSHASDAGTQGSAGETDAAPSPDRLNTTGDTSLTIGNTGGGSAHENKPPFLDFHFIIKT